MRTDDCPTCAVEHVQQRHDLYLGRENRDHLLRDYLVTLESGQQYRFKVEDEAHATDQAADAEPGDPVVTVTEWKWWQAPLRTV